MTSRPVYLIPTYHPAAEKLLRVLNEEFDIVFYNKNANERMQPTLHAYEFVDLKLSKIRLKRFDFAVTNTLPLAKFILSKRPKFVVTEDYLFCLPYLLLCKLLRIKIIYFNGSTAPQSTRVNYKLVKFFKSVLLRCFDEYWHGFKGADKYITEYVNVNSRLRPWFLMTKPEVNEVYDDSLKCIYVGEFSKRKRIEYVLAMREITNLSANLQIKISMNGCDRQSGYYAEEFSALPHRQTLELMSKQHVLFLLSEREAMGAVVLEALANGLFVVLSKEVGASSYVTAIDSVETNQNGILWCNFMGCVVDPALISPLELLNWLNANKSLIVSNRHARSEELSEHYV